MAIYSKIEWTEASWNPVTGCTPISDGCRNCYAARLAKRLKAMGNKRYVNGFRLTIHPDLIKLPLKWRQPKLIFVNSMSDLFHEDLPTHFISEIFDVMRQAHWHTFQILTKRSTRLAALAKNLPWTENIWMGVTVENGKYIHRISNLKKVPAFVRFVSMEPLIGPINKPDLSGIDWIIVGGESGPGCRPMKIEWVRSIRDHCATQNIPFFFKQWGGFNKKKSGRILDGKTWDQFPNKQFVSDYFQTTLYQ